MTTPDTCPKCGAELGGLGRCWADGCDYDHRTVRQRDKGGGSATPEPTEKEVQHAIKKALASVGGNALTIVDTSQPFRAAITKGLPDLILIVGGMGVYWRETKRPSGTLSEDQERFGAILQAAGEDWDVWRSAEDAMDWWKEVSEWE